MAISTDFLDAVALAAGRFPGPLVLPWPISGRPDGFLTFASFAEWRLFVTNLSLHAVVPEIVRAKLSVRKTDDEVTVEMLTLSSAV